MIVNLTWWEVLIMLATLVCVVGEILQKNFWSAIAWGNALIWQLDYFSEREKNREIKRKNS